MKILNYINHLKNNQQTKTNLVILFIIYSLLRIPLIFKSIGEQDQARFILQTINNEFGFHSGESPLYSILLNFLFSINNDIAQTVYFSNYINLFFGFCVIIIIYNISIHFFDTKTSFYSILLFLFTPSFWLSNLYGYPHLIAYFFYLLSIFAIIQMNNHSKSFNLFFFSSIIFYIISLLFKIDLILGIFLNIFLILFYLNNKKKRIYAFFYLLFIPLITYICKKIFFYSSNAPTISILSTIEWLSHYLKIFLKKQNSEIFWNQFFPIISSMGIIFFIGIIFTIFYLIKNKKWKYLIVNLLSSILPITFWFFIAGNSARHNMMWIYPLILLFTHQLTKILTNKLEIIILTIIVLNYFSIPPNSYAASPSTNILLSKNLITTRINHYSKLIKNIINTANNNDDIVIIGGFRNPYFLYNTILNNQNYTKSFSNNNNTIILKSKTNNKSISLTFLYDINTISNYCKQIDTRYKFYTFSKQAKEISKSQNYSSIHLLLNPYE